MDERIIIAMALKDNSLFDRVAFLQPEHFTNGNGEIYRDILSIYRDNDKVSGIDLVFNGIKFDYEIPADDFDITTSAYVVKEAAKLFDLYQLKLLKKSIGQLDFKDYDATLSAIKETVDRLEEQRDSQNETRPIDIDVYIKEFRDARKKEIKLGLELKTLPTMNNIIGGIMPTDLIGIYGKEKSSKTSLVHEIVLDLAVDQKIPVVIFNFEMSIRQMMMKTISMRTGLAVNEMRSPKFTVLTDEQYDGYLVDAVRKYEGTEIFIMDNVPNEIQIYQKAKEIKRLYNLKLIVIDYLMLVESHKNFTQRRDELNHLSRFFKRMAQKLKIPIILISQANEEGAREAEAKGLSRDSDYYFYVGQLKKGDTVDYGDYQYKAQDNDYLIHNRGIRHAVVGKPFVTRFIDNQYKEIDTRSDNGFTF